MSVLDRLIIRELTGPIVNSIFMFLAVLFGGAYLFQITDLLVQGAPFSLVLQIALFTLPVLVTQAFPMGMLLGTLLAFGRLSGDSEHVALFGCGVSMMRIARPVAVVGLVVSVAAFLWNEIVVPPAQVAFYDLRHSARENIEAGARPMDYIIRRDDGTVDQVVTIQGGYDAEQRRFRGVTILKMSDDPLRVGQPEVIVYAEYAEPRGTDPKGRDWVYHNVFITYLRPDPDRRTFLDTYSERASTVTLPRNVRMGRDFKGVLAQTPLDNRTMSFRALRAEIEQDSARGENTLGAQVDLWEKLSLPLASVIFGLVAAPLGLRPHRGSKAMGFGIAIGIIFAYWVLYRWMYTLGKGGGIPPMLASFTGCLIGLVVAGILIYRARQ
ncbi:MAG TPA: LptF/LptG family permease [Chthonomonadales bacterium]|nr:LptF/LptG family permease [Chthonomonadales bacterium]